MGALWNSHYKFEKMLQVEVAVAEVQASLGIIPKEAAKAIAKKSKFNVDRILEIEKTTRHDVIAFVSNVAENVGSHGKFIHFGMTSSDVLDTAFSLQVQDAGKLLLKGVRGLEKALEKIAKVHMKTLCPGRTHGMFAEPTSFGYKMTGFLAELKRNRQRVESALKQMQICKLSGAVGTYSSQPPVVESKVAHLLKLTPETVATQVVPRDRHAEMIWAVGMLGAGLERLAVEMRHLQRSEVSEVTEGFSKGQKGSSAMPHKKNPISAENITGAARILRSYVVAAMENVALWHERDISHSSVERVMFPDVFILADYAVYRMTQLVEGLDVHAARMMSNIESSQGQLYSSLVLLALVQKGLSREEAYSHVQRLSHSLQTGEHLRGKLETDSVVKKLLNKEDLEEIFSGKRHQKMIQSLQKSLAKRLGDANF